MEKRGEGLASLNLKNQAREVGYLSRKLMAPK
jgi:hypothetical protein